jgi:leader peptidase (prepilin peptidase)/N-methyltransferase
MVPALFAFIWGAMVGSFLNVVVYRLPRGMSLMTPSSHCPKCGRRLTMAENIPIAAWILQGGKCRGCGSSISPRYAVVEAATGIMFALFFMRAGRSPADGEILLTVAYWVFFSCLLAALFIDLELFIIPDELNAFAYGIGVTIDLVLMAMHHPDHAPLFGWLPRSLLGGAVCAAVFVLIQWLGLGLFKKDAMGDGDVKLARAIGAMLPLSVALVSFFLAIALGAVIGGTMLIVSLLREKGSPEPEQQDEDEPPYEPTPFGQAVLSGIGYILNIDLLVWFGCVLKLKPALAYKEYWGIGAPPAAPPGVLPSDPAHSPPAGAVQDTEGILHSVEPPGADLPETGAASVTTGFETTVSPTETAPSAPADTFPADDFVPGPTHIPFGPYMVVGAFLSVFIGEALVRWYLVWAGLAPPGP